MSLSEIPLPWVDDLLDALNESTVFSTLDLRKGCWQIKMLFFQGQVEITIDIIRSRHLRKTIRIKRQTNTTSNELYT